MLKSGQLRSFVYEKESTAKEKTMTQANAGIKITKKATNLFTLLLQ